MERAARILSRLRPDAGPLDATQLAVSAWPAAVGRRLAGKTRVTFFDAKRGHMIVEAEDAVWQKNLAALSAQILSNLRSLLGDSAPRWIEFRVGAPRRPVRREAVTPGIGLFAGEPSGIADPSLDYVYRQSRRKAGS
jgi:hypothetical protein